MYVSLLPIAQLSRMLIAQLRRVLSVLHHAVDVTPPLFVLLALLDISMLTVARLAKLVVRLTVSVLIGFVCNA